MFFWLGLKRTPLIIAHRGSSATAPENTLAAFHQAIEDGAEAIEFDVRLTRDRQLVVFHDNRLNRTSDGRGRLRDYNLSDLQLLSAGSWFHRRFAAEKIPTLEDVFDLVAGRVGINIEIKSDRQERTGGEILIRCLEIIRKYRAQRLVLLSSFVSRFVKEAKLLEPTLATGLLYHPLRHIVKSPITFAQSVQADYLILSGTQVRKTIVRMAHAQGLRVAEYTVNTARRIQRANNFEIDAFFSDHPSVAKEFLQSHRK